VTSYPLAAVGINTSTAWKCRNPLWANSFDWGCT
jgi:hypothetical protein